MEDLAEQVQLVPTDQSELTKGREIGVFSPRIWRLADLGAKHALLRSGLGWGGMPLDVVADNLVNGQAVRLDIAALPKGGLSLPMWRSIPLNAHLVRRGGGSSHSFGTPIPPANIKLLSTNAPPPLTIGLRTSPSRNDGVQIQRHR